MSMIKAFGVFLLAILLTFTACIILNVAGWQVDISDVSRHVYTGVLMVGWGLYFELKARR